MSPGKGRAMGACPQPPAQGTLQRQGLMVLSLPLRPLDGFQIVSLLEISLLFFLKQLKC